ncbi:MAG TPA: TA system VapC family ribonuclease toxin [Candidatus Polarisedimenticolaceae bacterium]|nr:TA system VapC family ribonuclease toxin [Candidatus Polarisedimenticolaceae bacterium]
MFVVDTNVLIYAAAEESPFHPACRERLTAWRAQPDAWYVTWGILYEFLAVSTHPRVMRKAWTARQAWTFVDDLLASPGLSVLVATELHAAVAAQVIADVPHLSGSLVHDAHTAVLMREHGIRTIYTRDTGFHRFPFVEPIDPIALHEPRRRYAGSRPTPRSGKALAAKRS